MENGSSPLPETTNQTFGLLSKLQRDGFIVMVCWLRDMANGPCTNPSNGHTCIEVGSSLDSRLCPRCLAKKTLQRACRELDVVDYSILKSKIGLIEEIHEATIGGHPNAKSNFPYGGWS
jgi:hypothetical protein